MLAESLAERAEDDSVLRELRLHRRSDRHRIEDRVDGDAGEELLLVQWDAELLVGLQQLRIYLVERSQRLLRHRRRVVAGALIVDRAIADVGPVWLLHGLPAAEGLE